MKAVISTNKVMMMIAVILIASVGVISCSTTDEKSTEDPVSDEASANGEEGGNNFESQGGNSEEASANSEGGEGENNATDNEFANQGEGEAAPNANAQDFGFENKGGEGINNATEDDSGNNGLNLGNNQPAANQGAEGEVAEGNSAAPANSAAAGANTAIANTTATNAVAGGNLGLTDASSTPIDDAATAAATEPVPSAALPSGGGIVKYIRSTISATNQAGSGQVMKTLETGDHPVVWDEGEFSRMSNGTYVPASSLSADGIGRPRNGGDWGGH